MKVIDRLDRKEGGYLEITTTTANLKFLALVVARIIALIQDHLPTSIEPDPLEVSDYLNDYKILLAHSLLPLSQKLYRRAMNGRRSVRITTTEALAYYLYNLRFSAQLDKPTEIVYSPIFEAINKHHFATKLVCWDSPTPQLEI